MLASIQTGLLHDGVMRLCEVLLIRFVDCHSYTRLYHEGPKFDLDDADALARNVKESQLALVGELASRWVPPRFTYAQAKIRGPL